MKYRELRIETEKKDLDPVLAELAAAGFDSVMIDDPEDAVEIMEEPERYKYDYFNEEIAADLGRRPVITLYFAVDEEGSAELSRAEELLNEARKSGRDLRFKVSETGDDSEWLYKWQENFRPTRVGERIVVRPSWEDYDPAPEDLVIEMDPGMAFGSGLHATTSMCIKALEEYFSEAGNAGEAANGAGGSASVRDTGSEENGAGKHTDGMGCGSDSCIRVLDVGTGTGILAIAAALLGAGDCLGIDIDDEAIRVGTENVVKNRLSDRIRIRQGDLTEGVAYEADVVVANLMADLVMRLAPAASEHLVPGGIFISSGILDIKEDAVSEAVREAGFEILEIKSDGEWRAIVAQKDH